MGIILKNLHSDDYRGKLETDFKDKYFEADTDLWSSQASEPYLI